MTAVDLDALDKLRDELAAAISESLGRTGVVRDAMREQVNEFVTDALLPVVDRIATARAAAELRAAAKVVALTPGIKFHGAAVRDVLARADELDPS